MTRTAIVSFAVIFVDITIYIRHYSEIVSEVSIFSKVQGNKSLQINPQRCKDVCEPAKLQDVEYDITKYSTAVASNKETEVTVSTKKHEAYP